MRITIQGAVLAVLLTIALCSTLCAQSYSPFSLWQRDGRGGSVNDYGVVASTGASQNSFVLGWNWGDKPPRDFSTALGMNLWHGPGGHYDNGITLLNTNAVSGMKIIWLLGFPDISGNSQSRSHLQAQAVQFDPAIAISTNGTFTVSSGDTEAGAFGFTNKTLGTVQQVDNRYVFAITRASLGISTSAVVLSSPWPDNQIFLHPINEGNKPNQYQGTHWYLSINLRRLNTAAGNSFGNEPVLKIRVPYTTTTQPIAQSTTTYIIFSEVSPSTTTHTLVATTCSYGLQTVQGARIDPVATTGTTEFIITRNMLPRIGSTETNITLSALFFTDGIITIHNPLLRTEKQWNSTDNVIRRLGLEISYLGNEDIAIDWVRFETPNARRLFWGEFDCEIAQALDEEMYEISTNNTMNAQVYRIYSMDEHRTQLFQAMGYFNKLMGGLATTERGPTFDPHYRQIVRPQDYWTGTAGIGALTAAPYLLRGHKGYPNNVEWRALFLNFKKGYDFHDNGTPLPSEYELEGYSGGGLQAHWDDKVQASYLQDNSAGSTDKAIRYEEPFTFLYQNTWWANIWVNSEWATTLLDGTRFPLLTDSHRPKTGEEIRLLTWTPLLLGAKGLVYHRAVGHSLAQKNYADSFIGPLSSTSTTITIQPGESELAYLQREELGTDFLQYSAYGTATDNSGLDEFIQVHATAANFGVPPDRIYLGRKSTRLEIKKMNDWIRSTEATLMALQLQAWFGKGHTEVTSGNYTLLQNYIRIKETATSTVNTTTVRPPGRINISGSPDYERQDSTFYDITLLKHKDKNLQDEFIVGVLNRRTDPIVVVPTTATFTINGKTVNGTSYGRPTAATLPALPVGQEFRFFTTAEFDALSTTATPVPSGKLGMYSQRGAREIAIRFNYKTADADYQLLRVQELGGGLDTVVGENSQLAVLYKPGEGKLFRVTPLPAQPRPTGDLAYSNQRKMVAYPKQGSPNELYYHMAYQRTTGGVSRVYYRRSKVVTTGTISENIEWQAEKQLTVTTASGIQCGYPSLVVRNNSAGVPTVYVVYACTGATIPSTNIQIVENAFDAEADYSTTGTGKGLYMSKGSTLATWGTPVVSAGARGNYYAWADKDMGIAVGYKSTSATSISAIKFVSWATTGTKNCMHPSLNTYSRFAWQENEAALVWQENGHIYYTRIYDATTGTTKLRVFPNSRGVVQNTANTIARLSEPDCSSQNEFPVVYRSIETDYRWQYPWGYLDGLFDRVFWEAVKTTGERVVCARKIDLSDMVSTTMGRKFKYVHFLPLSTILFSSLPPFRSGLHQVDVTQGRLLMQYGHNMSDSAVIVSLVSSTQSGQSAYGNVWHIPLHYWTSLVNSSHSLASLRNRSWLLTGSARQPHLAAKPSFANIGSWHLNRRIFENTASSILTSAQQFYRTTRDEEAITPLPGFAKACTKYIIAEPYIDQTELLWKAQAPEVVVNSTDTLIRARLDTMFTDWFPIGSSADISFYAMGTDTSLVQLELVKQSDGSRQTLSLEPVTDTTARLLTRTVVNGGGDMYRLEMRKQDTHAGFIEDILLGQLPVEDGMGGVVPARRGTDFSSSIIVDLAKGSYHTSGVHAHVYPNPADDIVYISVSHRNAATTPGRLETQPDDDVVVVNALGETVYRAQAPPGAVLRMNTSRLPSGVYFVRVLQPGAAGTTAPFVINR